MMPLTCTRGSPSMKPMWPATSLAFKGKMDFQILLLPFIGGVGTLAISSVITPCARSLRLYYSSTGKTDKMLAAFAAFQYLFRARPFWRLCAR